MNFNWILVPINFSKDSRRALEVADSRAAASEGGLILLHVDHRESTVKTRLAIDQGPLEKWTRFIKKTSAKRIAYITCRGKPEDEILRIAQQYEVSAIVMGRGGTGQRAGKIAQAVLLEFPQATEWVSANTSGTQAAA